MTRALVPFTLILLSGSTLRTQQPVTTGSPEGKNVAVAQKQVIAVSDARTKKALLSIRAHRTFSADEKCLLSAVGKLLWKTRVS